MSATVVWVLFFVVVPVLCFSYSVFYRPTSLWTGFLFFISVSTIYLTVIVKLEAVNSRLAVFLALPAIILLLLINIFGMTAGVIGLFWNERVLLKKEGFSISNLLPLIVGVGLILFQVMLLVVAYYSSNPYITSLSSFISLSFGYIVSIFFFYFLTSLLYNWFPITYKVDYIIVLGAGLINGERVTPLLASRIDAGVALYDKQVKKYQHHPTIILSGGQGPDEKISEAQAMMNYIEDKGYEINCVYLEEKSTNTKENLQFSEQIAYKNDNIKDFNRKNIVLASNNYHVLRAGKLGNKIGIFARAVGSRTKCYYLPTAFIREYIGYLHFSKRKHIIVLSSIFVVSLLFLVIQLIL